MSSQKKYNGWTNYVTWKVFLEYLSDTKLTMEQANMPRLRLADTLKLQFIEDILLEEGEGLDDKLQGILAEDFALEVNWEEIAWALQEDFAERKGRELAYFLVSMLGMPFNPAVKALKDQSRQREWIRQGKLPADNDAVRDMVLKYAHRALEYMMYTKQEVQE